MLENFRTSDEMVANYITGQKLLKGAPPQVRKGNPLTNMLRNARKQHHAQNPIVPNMADYVNWIIYDRLSYAAGATVPTNAKMFTVPIGTSSKTKSDTNLDQVSQLPSPYWMNVTGIGFYFDPNVLPIDLDAFLNQSYLEFWVNNKVYIEGKFQSFPGAAGIYGATTQTGISQMNLGMPLVSNLYDLRLPSGINLGSDASGAGVTTDGLTGITILQNQTFKIEVNLPGGSLALSASTLTPNPGTGLVLSCYLHGILSRSVQ